MEIKNSSDLLGFLFEQSEKNPKSWFGFPQQKLTGIDLVHKIAANHADKMTPEEVTEYVAKLNNCIYDKFIKM